MDDHGIFRRASHQRPDRSRSAHGSRSSAPPRQGCARDASRSDKPTGRRPIRRTRSGRVGATANRIFTLLKAILNRAFHDGLIADDSAWRKVKPLPKVDEARIRFLTVAGGVRLINACAKDLRALVQAALLTGARYGELRS